MPVLFSISIWAEALTNNPRTTTNDPDAFHKQFII